MSALGTSVIYDSTLETKDEVESSKRFRVTDRIAQRRIAGRGAYRIR